MKIQPSTDGPRCPYCGSRSTELLSLFGSQLLTEQYYCTVCRTPFEHVRDDAALPPPQPEFMARGANDG